MKNKILALLAVAAVGSVAAAQQTQNLGTAVAVVNAFTEPVDLMGLVINTPDTSTMITTTTNDGNAHDISVVADAGGWAFAPTVNGTLATGYPALTITTPDGSGELISIVNAVTAPVVVVNGATNVFEDNTAVTLAASVAEVNTLAAGDYTTTLTYTMN